MPGRHTHLLGRLRLATGLFLFFYVLTHNLNHALGLVSLAAMDAGRIPFLAFWRFPPIEILFLLSIVTHFALGMRALYNRHSLRMPFWEGAQLILGLSIPPLLTLHFLGTAVAHWVFGLDDAYEETVLALASSGILVAVQTTAVLVTWIHGCIGIGFWLRLKPWYPKARIALFTAALLIPVLSLLGFAQAAREVLTLAKQPGWFHDMAVRRHLPGREAVEQLYLWLDFALVGYAVIVLGVLVGRYLRDWLIRHRAVRVAYPDGKVVNIQPGSTILEASRIGNIPHASVCGGRGRCSTCRVRILAGDATLPPPSVEELRVLARVGAAPGTRLACQARPQGYVKVVPLLPPGATSRQAQAQADFHSGKEREIAVLFADIRGFTQFSEQRLPYDVVFLLNRYFRAMGEAVIASGGHLDKFIGDGVMALFGVDGKPGNPATQALDAARRMSLNLAEMNASFGEELQAPLRIGIGIHYGPAIVGEMGFGTIHTLTAVGDTVNTASRLETATKELNCQLVVSETLVQAAEIPSEIGKMHEIELRGRSATLHVYAIKNAATLEL
ncbi:adenylate/guanylate cyclase domain-containing protein [Dongia sedimenti]|uniref:Adenylate/guanylate cyclase domain-containing protein n=1 Tax=Dongia sedimenti TaxID=3064282 RepID=A0ABU0YS19_9PROT|nr:adenylate/guanylate cyclase domain-containing protein [Rhodospirillaceae bacterium R-7]